MDRHEVKRETVPATTKSKKERERKKESNVCVNERGSA